MALNSITNETKTAPSNDTIFNPKSQLDKDAFLKLYLLKSLNYKTQQTQWIQIKCLNKLLI